MKRQSLIRTVAATSALTAVIPASGAAATIVLQTLLDPPGTTLNLSNADSYIGGGNIDRDLIIEGNNALVDLDGASGSAPLELKIRSGRNVQIRNTRFRDGSEFFSIIVEAGATLTLTNCQITNAARGVTVRDASTVVINGGSIQGSIFAVELRGGSTGTVTGTALSGSGTAILSAENNSTATVRECTFSGAPASVLSAQSSSLTLDDLTINGIATAQTVRVFGANPTLVATNLNLHGQTGKAFDITNANCTLSNIIITTGPNDSANVTASVNSANVGFVFNSPGMLSMSGLHFRGLFQAANIYDPSGTLNFASNTMTNCRRGWNIVRPESTVPINGLTATGVVENTVRLENADSIMENFTLTNCTGQVIDLINNSSLIIRNTTMTDCATQQFNTAINGTDSSVILDGSVSIIKPPNVAVIAGATKVNRGHLEIRANNHISGYALGAHYLTNCTGSIRFSRFENNGEGIYVDESDVLVEDNIINDNIIGQALQSEGRCNIVFRRNEVYASVESGNGINSSGTILIEDNYYQDVQFGGISISPEDASPVTTIRRNTTRNAGNPGGVFVSGSGVRATLNSHIRGTAYGLHDTGDNNTFERSFILAPLENQANMAPATTQQLRYNYFDGGLKGLLYTTGRPHIIGNHAVNVGMPGALGDFAFFFAPGDTSPAAFSNNNVQSASGHGLWISSGPPAPAQDNFWGSASGPRPDVTFPGNGAIVNNAITSPFLTEAPTVAGYQDHSSYTAGVEKVSNFGSDAIGMRLLTIADSNIPDITVAAWATRSNPTLTDTAAVIANGDPRIYVNVLDDARITIRGGTSRLRVMANRLAWADVQPGSFVAWYHREEDNTWQSLPAAAVSGGAEVALPTHAVTLMIANGENPFADIVCMVLGSGCTAADLSSDGVRDAADVVRVALMN